MNIWKFETPSGDRYELVGSEVVAGRFIAVTTVSGATSTEVMSKARAMKWMSEIVSISIINFRLQQPAPKMASTPTKLAPSPNATPRRRRRRINWDRGEHPRGGIYIDTAPVREK